MPFEGETSFPRKANGHFFTRSTLCNDPEITSTATESHTCTGEHVHVLPPTCVVSRKPEAGCLSTKRNGCAGRPWSDCPEGHGGSDDMCFLPKDPTPWTQGTAKEENRVTRHKLEQCASVVASFNGPNFALRLADGNGLAGGLPNDNAFDPDSGGNPTQSVTRHALPHGARFAGSVQEVLKTLWPYPVCPDGVHNGDSCTTFPVPVPQRNDDGGLQFDKESETWKCLVAPDYNSSHTEECPSGSMSFLNNKSGNGALDYHCTWAVLHTLSFNGQPVLTAKQKKAFGELLMYISGQFDCKVCRNNFVEIIQHFGLPTGNVREDYARWLWQAHNNANEHTYATHSYNKSQAIDHFFDLVDLSLDEEISKDELNAALEGQHKTQVSSWIAGEHLLCKHPEDLSKCPKKFVDEFDDDNSTTVNKPEFETHLSKMNPQTRSNGNWALPPALHPWYMTFENAMKVWTDLPGLDHHI